MPRNKHITPGSADYYNRLTRAGVRIHPGGRVTQVVRGSDGVARVEDRGESKGATIVLGENGQYVPALETTEVTIVVETGPGTTGQLAHIESDGKER